MRKKVHKFTEKGQQYCCASSTLRDLVTPLNKRNTIMCVWEGSGGLVYCEEGVCVGGGALVLRYATG